jgi:hypothetical protein
MMTTDPLLRRARHILHEASKLLEDDGIPFRHSLSPPEEFRDPDLGRAHRLDREQEMQGLDTHRQAEDIPTVSGRGRG